MARSRRVSTSRGFSFSALSKYDTASACLFSIASTEASRRRYVTLAGACRIASRRSASCLLKSLSCRSLNVPWEVMELPLRAASAVAIPMQFAAKRIRRARTAVAGKVFLKGILANLPECPSYHHCAPKRSTQAIPLGSRSSCSQGWKQEREAEEAASLFRLVSDDWQIV